MNVLIISDNTILGNLLARELQGESFRSSVLSDLFQIWRHIERSHPDLVLVDVDLQRYSCWQLLLDIKSAFSELPVLIYVYNGPESFGKLKQAIDAAIPQRFYRRRGLVGAAPAGRHREHPA
jgi:DNA-binding response OmpR family regulator